MPSCTSEQVFTNTLTCEASHTLLARRRGTSAPQAHSGQVESRQACPPPPRAANSGPDSHSQCGSPCALTCPRQKPLLSCGTQHPQLRDVPFVTSSPGRARSSPSRCSPHLHPQSHVTCVCTCTPNDGKWELNHLEAKAQ